MLNVIGELFPLQTTVKNYKIIIININSCEGILVKIYSISTIRKKVREYGKKISAPTHLLTIRSSSDGFGTPHIEIDENGYNYVVSERGTEFERKQTKDINLILYWIFKPIIFRMASDYELENRKPNEDSRRQLFAKLLKLMEQLDSNFAKWEKEELDKFLEKDPYENNL